MNKSLLSLLLIVPFPSLGVLVAMFIFPNAPLGQSFFTFAKVWPVFGGLVLHKFYLKSPITVPKWSLKGMLPGVIFGSGLLIISLMSFKTLFSMFVDREMFMQRISEIGLDNKTLFFGLSIFWCLVNSFIEEFLWRGFVNNRCLALIKNYWGAIALGALFFTLHHIFSLLKYSPIPAVVFGSVTVFMAGYFWSWLLKKYNNIWACYISHILADLAVFVPAYLLIFH